MTVPATASPSSATIDFEVVGGRVTGTVAIEGGRPVSFDDAEQLEAILTAAASSTPALVLVPASGDEPDGEALAQLTAREREVVAAAAGGATNREIAESLFYSVKSIEAYLTRVYRKLEISGRRELRTVYDGVADAPADEDSLEDLEVPDDAASRLKGGGSAGSGHQARRMPRAHLELVVLAQRA